MFAGCFSLYVDLHVAWETKMDCNQSCDLANRDAHVSPLR